MRQPTERRSNKGRGPTQDKLTKLLLKNPRRSLDELAAALGKISPQRVRVAAKAQGWKAITHTEWSRTA